MLTIAKHFVVSVCNCLRVSIVALILGGTSIAHAQDQAAAAAALAKNDYVTAIALYGKLVQEHPSEGRFWEQLGIAYLLAGKYADARQSLQNAIDNGYAAPAGKYNLACAYARLGDKESALGLLSELIANGGVFPMATDADLASLSNEPHFKELVRQAHQNAQPCTNVKLHPEYRQFDFWLGDWEVFSGTQKVGENHVELILGACVVFENWRATSGSEGKSLNKFNPATNKWDQFWVADDGTTLHYVGEFIDGEMRYSREMHPPAGQPAINRLTFSKLSNNRVRQLSTISTDDGKTWATNYDLVYVKK